MINRLKELRRLSGKTQKETAAALNISEKTYGHYECGYRKPDIDNLRTIAKYFGVTTDFLIGEEDKMSLEQVSSRFLSKMRDKGILDEEIQHFFIKVERFTREEFLTVVRILR